MNTVKPETLTPAVSAERAIAEIRKHFFGYDHLAPSGRIRLANTAAFGAYLALKPSTAADQMYEFSDQCSRMSLALIGGLASR